MKKLLLLPALAGLALSLGASAADGLMGKKPSAEPQFLPVDEAFEIQPLEDRSSGKTAKLVMGWRIAKGYYLYQERMKFTLSAPVGVVFKAPALPAGEKHDDEHFGPTVVYRGMTQAELPLSQLAKGKYSLAVSYQGCADAGLCYPPQTRTLEFTR